MYFLCGTDFHGGNFIPAGEWPVPIDLEAILMTGIHVLPQECNLPRYLHPVGQNTMLFSLMSCFWRAGDYDQVLFSATGINGGSNRPSPISSKVWKELGTDGLKQESQYRNFDFDQSLPQLQGQKIPVNDYREQVVQGFLVTYRTLMKHQYELLHPQGFLAAFRTVTTRAVLRDTQEYSNIIFWSRAADQLTSGAAYDVALEFLYTQILVCPNLPFLEVLDEEKRCCWEQNIPIYYGSPSSLDIYSCNGVSYKSVVEKTSFEQMQQRFQEASEEDLIWQSELLRVSLQMSIYPGGKQAWNEAVQNRDLASSQLSLLGLQSFSPSKQWLSIVGWSGLSRKTTNHQQSIINNQKQQLTTDNQSLKARLLTCAFEIGEALAQLAINHAHGNSWLSLSRVFSSSAMVKPIHPDPWHSIGATGTSIFLANLACESGDERYEQLARGALKFTASMLHHFINTGLWDELPISGYNGICLFVYALAECGRRLQDEALIEQALDWALKLTPERLRQEKKPDVLGGAAGALLALLHLHKLHPDSRLIERTLALGEGILKCQRSEKGSQGWWVPDFERPLLGMGHGAAGIAYALLRLYALTGQEHLRLCAESGLAYERAHFCHQAQDWPDFRQKPGKIHFMTGWCAGAPGIGLARLGILGILNDESEIRGEIDLAITATQRHLGKHQHHLCCGEAGRIAFLSAAAQRLERPELLPIALDAGLKMINFYEQVGHWRLQEFSERNQKLPKS